MMNTLLEKLQNGEYRLVITYQQMDTKLDFGDTL